MKICLVSQEYPPETAQGGIGSQNFNKARALTRLGHEIHVVSASNKPGSTRRTEIHEGISVHRIPTPGSQFPVNQPPTYWLGYSWEVLRQLGELHRETAFDLIDFADYAGEGFAYQLDRSTWNWVPIVVQLHGPLAMFTERIGWPPPGSDLARVGAFMEGESIRLADGLMSCSANIADYVASHYGIGRETIDVVHCGVDADTFTPSNRAAASPPTILFVGSLAAFKGIHTVFNAFLNLHPRYPDLRLQVLGKGGEAELVQRLRKQAAAAGAEKNVEFVGFVADRAAMPDFYRNASVFCSPAHHEVGVANVYIEAMGCGCPVIAADTGGAPEAVTEGVSGLLVPPDNIKAMTAALDRILSNPALGRRMGEAGRNRVIEYFAMDKYIQRVLATYQKAIRRSKEKLDRLEHPESDT